MQILGDNGEIKLGGGGEKSIRENIHLEIYEKFSCIFFFTVTHTEHIFSLCQVKISLRGNNNTSSAKAIYKLSMHKSAIFPLTDAVNSVVGHCGSFWVSALFIKAVIHRVTHTKTLLRFIYCMS